MKVFALWENWEKLNGLDALLVALIAIVIVFLVLIIVIAVTFFIQKGMDKVESHTSILPKKENAILAEDEDAVVAVQVASIDFYRETGKEPEVVSVQRIED